MLYLFTLRFQIAKEKSDLKTTIPINVDVIEIKFFKVFQSSLITKKQIIKTANLEVYQFFNVLNRQ